MAARPIIETRSEQMFPALHPAEIERLRHFGATRTYDSGLAIGDVSPGMFVILKGEVAITPHSVLGPRRGHRHAASPRALHPVDEPSGLDRVVAHSGVRLHALLNGMRLRGWTQAARS
jgi:hypothetical protein